WRATVAYGLGSMILLAFPNLLGELPLVGNVLQKKVVSRLTGHRAEFAGLDKLLRTVPRSDGRPPLVVAPNYQRASLATFYLPGHPAVAARGYYTNRRLSNLDHWPESDLGNPGQKGRTLVLMLNGRDPRWEDVFDVEQIRPTEDPGYIIALNFHGPRAPKNAG